MSKAAERAEDGERAARLTDEALRLAYVDPHRGLELAVAAAAVAPPESRAAALLAAARCAATTSDWASSTRLADEGLKALDGVDDPGVRTRLLATRADAAVRAGELTEAHALAVEALGIADEQDDLEGAARALWALGNTYYFLGDLTAAQGAFGAARTLFGRLGDPVGAALMSDNIGEILVRRGEPRAAAAAHRRAIEVLRYAAPVAMPRGLLMLADALTALGDPAGALAIQDEALAEAVATGRTDMEGLAYAARGWSMASLGRHRDARAAFEVGLELARRASFREAELEALLGLGMTDIRLGALDRAGELLQQAGTLAATSHQRRELGRAHRLLADLYESRGAIERAYGHLRASIAATELPVGHLGLDTPTADEIRARWAPEAEA